MDQIAIGTRIKAARERVHLSQEHLQKIGLEIPEETYRMQLQGKVNYVLQVHPDDRDMLNARKWLQQSTK